MKYPLTLIALVVLTGCEQKDASQELDRFIVQTYSAAEVTATPLPPEPVYAALPFNPAVDTDPFVLPAAEEEDTLAKGDCWQPSDLPSRDSLEGYELASLDFKGVIGLPGSYWALVEAPDSTIHRVGIGRMMGNNRGRVDSISQHTLSITEHLPDGLGCWQVRNVRLALNNNK
ncbi:pilus assembly protein PilP [Enterovibrio makurazakiensis]|uniref:Pilus assembly protein PilP n=1 Tax=Enterovibrio gelatinilyticus TaxID=2899819 RepID=A0ABT5R8S9_9GAMM|nr:pilus assembly protein PilP [Enterovibrio sp. ZSDZ42]MDD1795927.1 pilus assembly protein PilP [Enterovibrio sp. ZSDZ42]